MHLTSGDLWAGAEAATLHLLEALSRRSDLKVGALVLNHGELVRRLRRKGLAVEVEPEGGRSFVGLARAVRRRLRGTDLVHAHRYKENLLAALSGRPWISTQHGRTEPFAGAAALRMRGYLALDRWLKRHSAVRVVAVSGEMEEELARALGRARVVRAWNGIEDPALRVAVPRWQDRAAVVGTLGRLTPVKGLDLAVEAVARCPGLRLEIVGEGPERAALEARASELGAAERVRFSGFDPHPLGRVASWRALLVPSRHEGNPVSVIEALAVGTPVVAGPLPGVAELVGERAGWILDTRDPARWAEDLSERVHRSDAGARASSAARERYLEAFTADAAARRMAKVYREALGGSSRRRARSIATDRPLRYQR